MKKIILVLLFTPLVLAYMPKWLKHRIWHSDCQKCDTCDVSTIPKARIVGGDPTLINRYPFIVSIQYKRVLSRHVCGGSILSPRWILSAAHCVCAKQTQQVMYASKFVVLAGLTNCRSIIFWRSVSEVQAVFKHPQYDAKNVYNDIALLKLMKPLKISGNIQLTNLASKDIFSQGEPINFAEECIALGWGYTKEKGLTSDVLRIVELPVMHNAECSRLLFQGSYLRISQMCTLFVYGGKDACQGDSGGPLVCNDIQIGLTSWGYGCARAYKPGVWTRVDQYLDWIDGIRRRGRNIFMRSGRSDAIRKIFNVNNILVLLLIEMIIVYYI